MYRLYKWVLKCLGTQYSHTMEESVQVSMELHMCWACQGTGVNSDCTIQRHLFRAFWFAAWWVKIKPAFQFPRCSNQSLLVILSHGRIATFRPFLNTWDYSMIIQNPAQAPPSPLFVLPSALWMLWVRAACFTGGLVSQKAGCWSLDACRPAICATSYPS